MEFLEFDVIEKLKFLISKITIKANMHLSNQKLIFCVH